MHVRNLATDSEAKVHEKDPLFWLYQEFWLEIVLNTLQNTYEIVVDPLIC